MKRAARLIAINVVIVGFLITLLNVGSLIGLAIYDAIRPIEFAKAHRYPNYRDTDWAEIHFAEYAQIQSSFEAFYGWRYEPFQGQTITIDDESKRESVNGEAASPDRSVAFFGGSTLWGVGADNAGTIPSIYGTLNPDRQAVNFGTVGFNAHQELNLLIKALSEGYRSETVVFYDGVNDALQKCHIDNSDAVGHAQETQIRYVLQENQRWSDPPLHFAFQPTIKLIEQVRNILFKTSGTAPSYDCDQRPEKAEAIARLMLTDWRIARQQAESHGAEFLGVLQPTAYGSKSRLDHLEFDPVWARQYATVYPVIVALLEDEFADLKDAFLDLRTALDRDDYFFIDWCHLSPTGNDIIATLIHDAIRPIEFAKAHRYPNYRDTDWAEIHFAEYAQIQSSFEAFYGWRYEPFQGQTITIDDESKRESVNGEAASPDRSVAFFGGSTLWGVGADNAGTIPSIYGTLNPDRQAVNFGTVGFNAHQELNLLIKALSEGYRSETVVFYDGVNDALQKCHIDNSDAVGHAQETQIRYVLQENQRWSDPPLHFAFQPTIKLIEQVRNILFKTSGTAPSYDCDQRPEKAEAIARLMLTDWRIARQQAESHGAEFLGVLQPTAYGSKSRLDHLEFDPVWARQYATVYPVIVALLEDEFADLKDAFLDLRTALDRDDYFFIDWCHLSPTGNDIIATLIHDAIRPIEFAKAHRYPNYRDTDWAEIHFAEYAQIQSSFEAFYGWRYEPFQGQTITIDDESKRESVNGEAASPDRAVAFFGGSTLWGVGADDAGTIPSIYGTLNPDRQAVNFGMIGFNAHQELNLLIKALSEGYRPETVVFYDGVNDALQKCHIDNTDAFGHAQETRIRHVLQENQHWSAPPLHFALQPTVKLIEQARKILFKTSASAPSYDCDQQPEKAEAIARLMLTDWRIARQQAERHGAQFLAVLQPTAFGSKSRLSHLKLDPIWARQYETVYPIVVNMLEGEFSDLKDVFLDLRTALDRDDYFFIDWCHLSPNGNDIIATLIDAAIRQRGGNV